MNNYILFSDFFLDDKVLIHFLKKNKFKLTIFPAEFCLVDKNKEKQFDLLEKFKQIITNKGPQNNIILSAGPIEMLAFFINNISLELKCNISNILLMGGSFDGGNITEYAEYNLYKNPKAFQDLIKTKLPISLFCLNSTRDLYVRKLDYEKTKDKTLKELLKKFENLNFKHKASLNDLILYSYIVNPLNFSSFEKNIDIILEGEKKGMLIDGPYKLRVKSIIDKEKFYKIFEDSY
ncbi:nucleoside hydrolase [Citroniella saccharovorans]|uniref:Nucleoside hydrolase n=1 Tax=Citroniella saccharovorans TaxID=2053367 RepID=A0AAW9MR97_9FIRM|nr:nucleoside hydrolase [Citroniella saccharovorans]MEB3428448.1 nucleoside hydrolase [Citroniella saccharovorans]